MSPITRILLAVLAVLWLASCGSKSSNDGGGGANPGPAPAPADTRLSLKHQGVNKVMIGSAVDLRKYLNNSEAADYRILQGATSVQWESAEIPKLRFIQGGQVTVLVTDSRDNRSVALEFQVVFDSTGIIAEPGNPGEELPDPEDPVFQL